MITKVVVGPLWSVWPLVPPTKKNPPYCCSVHIHIQVVVNSDKKQTYVHKRQLMQDHEKERSETRVDLRCLRNLSLFLFDLF